MLEPAGDLGLEQESGAAVGVVGALGLDLFQSDLAPQLGIKSDGDQPDASASVQVQDLEPVAQGTRRAQAPFVFGIGLLVVIVIGRESRRIETRFPVESHVLTFGPRRIRDRDRGHRRMMALLSGEPPVEVATQAAEGAQVVQTLAQVALMSRQEMIGQQFQYRSSISRQCGAGDQGLGKRSSHVALGRDRFAGFVQNVTRNETQVDRQGFE